MTSDKSGLLHSIRGNIDSLKLPGLPRDPKRWGLGAGLVTYNNPERKTNLLYSLFLWMFGGFSKFFNICLGIFTVISEWLHTVDGQNSAPPRMMIISLFYRVLTIPRGAGFLPSTAWFELELPCFECSHFIAAIQPNTFQRTNISHLGNRKIIFKMPFLGDMMGIC